MASESAMLMSAGPLPDPGFLWWSFCGEMFFSECVKWFSPLLTGGQKSTHSGRRQLFVKHLLAQGARSAFELLGRARRMTEGDAAPARPAGHDPNEPSVGSAVAAQPPGSEREAVSRGYAEAEEPAGATSSTHVYKRGVPPERGGFISIQAVEELQSVAWRYGQNPCAHWRGNSSW